VTAGRQPLYVCGHSAGELARLETQGAFFEEITRDFLARAGLSPGMSVLDIGCGVGDVSFLAADIVGPSGRVLGVDHAAEAIATATARADTCNLGNVTFRLAEIDELTTAPVDALVGRFVLMHQADPARCLREAAAHVRPGGVVAMIESLMFGSVAAVHSSPHSPTYERIVRWIVQVIEAAGARADMGLALGRTFLDAGLPAPTLALRARVEGGADATIYRYMTESLRSMLPLAERFGIATLTAADVDGLERQLREEVTSAGGVLTSPLLVGAWCRAA
jgi:ubiquinone/menaquinone biosynthesis C-methylase UbiE